jgi:hypothetical protein
MSEVFRKNIFIYCTTCLRDRTYQDRMYFIENKLHNKLKLLCKLLYYAFVQRKKRNNFSFSNIICFMLKYKSCQVNNVQFRV